jgi:hypothetical protein
VRSAAMLYLAINVNHSATFMGIPGTQVHQSSSDWILGRVVKVFFTGDEKVTDSKVYLETCIARFSRALHDVAGIRMLSTVYKIMKGLSTF